MQIRALKYTWQGWPAGVRPGYLAPLSRVPSRDTVNVTFWITAVAPPGARAGAYRGTLLLRAASGGTATADSFADVGGSVRE